jgi:hypothetical protein
MSEKRWRVEWREVHVVHDVEAKTAEEALKKIKKRYREMTDTRLEVIEWWAEPMEEPHE